MCLQLIFFLVNQLYENSSVKAFENRLLYCLNTISVKTGISVPCLTEIKKLLCPATAVPTCEHTDRNVWLMQLRKRERCNMNLFRNTLFPHIENIQLKVRNVQLFPPVFPYLEIRNYHRIESCAILHQSVSYVLRPYRLALYENEFLPPDGKGTIIVDVLDEEILDIDQPYVILCHTGVLRMNILIEVQKIIFPLYTKGKGRVLDFPVWNQMLSVDKPAVIFQRSLVLVATFGF